MVWTTGSTSTLDLRRDLWVFRTAYLPVLLRSLSPDLVQRWQWTVQALADALSHEGDSRVATLVEERVLQLFRTDHPKAEYLLSPPHGDFLLVADRLRWHIYPLTDETANDREEHVRYVLRWAGAGDETAVAPWLELRQVLSTVQEFFQALPPTSDKRMGGYVSVLPVLAELDPSFATQTLDRGRLVAAVEGDSGLTPQEREKQLSVLGSRFYSGCLCHGLALVLEALANNHFPEIAPLLALPDVHADAHWCGLMPKILLATLYRKVAIVQDWA